MSDQIVMGDVEISLEELAGLDMEQVEEFRFSVTPKGVYMFRGVEASIATRETDEGNKAAVEFVQEITQVLSTDDPNPDSLIGRQHKETFWINDPKKSLGAIKAFMVDSGITGSGPLQELLTQFIGVEFGAQVSHRKDRNDHDKIYAGLRKIKPAAEMADAV